MDSKQVAAAVQQYLYKHSYIYQASNYSRQGWHECDILALSRNMLTREVEIKVSRSDFFADKKKAYKHEILSKRITGKHSKIPNTFYYAVPFDLVKIHEVPEYAGLMYVTEAGECTIVKTAPNLHRGKVTHGTILGMLDSQSAKLIFGCSYMTHKNKLVKEKFLSITANDFR